MLTTKRTLTIVSGALLIAVVPTMAPKQATAGTFGKIVNSIAYPVKKMGNDASTDTHKAIGHNSVQKAPHTDGQGKEVVKPDGHKVPVN